MRFRLFSASSGVTERAGLGAMVWEADIEWGLMELLETNTFVPSAPDRTSAD